MLVTSLKAALVLAFIVVNVLLSDDSKITVGTPTVAGAVVSLQVKEHLRGPKLIVFKMKRRKRYRNKKGHRQELTKVVVTDIKLS